MNQRAQPSQSGFTLIEVLIAIAILAGSVIVLTSAWSGNFLRIRKSNVYNNAALLLERKMVELEALYRDRPVTEIPEKDAGDFGKDFPQYRWTFQSREFEMPDLTPVLVGPDGADETLISMIRQTTELINKAVKELKLTVFVKNKDREVEFSVTNYFVDYQGDLGLGALGGTGGGVGGTDSSGSKDSSPSPNPSGGGGSP